MQLTHALPCLCFHPAEPELVRQVAVKRCMDFHDRSPVSFRVHLSGLRRRAEKIGCRRSLLAWLHQMPQCRCRSA